MNKYHTTLNLLIRKILQSKLNFKSIETSRLIVTKVNYTEENTSNEICPIYDRINDHVRIGLSLSSRSMNINIGLLNTFIDIICV